MKVMAEMFAANSVKPVGLVASYAPKQAVQVGQAIVPSGRSDVVKKGAESKRSVVPQALLANAFPHPPKYPGASVRCTIQNVAALLDGYGITVKYDVIAKKTITNIPGHKGSFENSDNVTLSHVESLATLNEMATTKIPKFVEVLADQNLFNPVSEWIRTRPWDGVDRLPEFYGTLVHREGYPVHLKEALVRRWLLSAAAAVLMPCDFHCRGVLTLQGPQAIGKTAWLNSLVPDPAMRQRLIKSGHHIDPSNKDTLVTAVTHWITEIGELDSSFKKDIARLKGFITESTDKVRRPYARADSEYPRRTVFCASVNDANFLVDTTGNSRWWTIPVTAVKHDHGIDMQQLFAQIAVLYEGDEQWWLTPEEEVLLTEQNKNHVVVNAVHEVLREAVDWTRIGEEGLPAMTPTQLLHTLQYDRPTNPQCKEAGAFLRLHFGESKRINGRDIWRVPLRQDLHDAAAGTYTMAPSSQHKAMHAGRSEDDF
jgi:hypothetical protein